MASEKRIAANRRNAMRSTGPKTTAGKSRSRLNAVKHGLSASLPVIVENEATSELARLLSKEAGGASGSAAARLAWAETVIERCRQVRASLAVDVTAGSGDVDAQAEAIATSARQMAAVDRYERRARRMAMVARQELDTAGRPE